MEKQSLSILTQCLRQSASKIQVFSPFSSISLNKIPPKTNYTERKLNCYLYGNSNDNLNLGLFTIRSLPK